MLPMRKRDDAEGERRIMGSGRRFFLGCEANAAVVVPFVAGAFGCFERCFAKKISAVLRTCEKS